VLQVQQANKDTKVKLGLLVQQEKLERMERLVEQVPQDLKVQMAKLVKLE